MNWMNLMKFRLPYGKTALLVDLPDDDDITCIEPAFVPAIEDPNGALRTTLQAPIGCQSLSSQVNPSERVGIIFNDITRPTPSGLMIHSILEQLAHIPKENITLFNALGTHRSNSDRELRQMLGDELVDGYRIVQNNCSDPSTHVCLGTSHLGHEIWINRALYECDLKILTGFIEPHFFAGFSGGGKAVMPGMAGLSTILQNHNASMISHPLATWGVTNGNPIWEEVQEVAHTIGKTFLVNVTLNKNKQISGVYCGDLDGAHKAGCLASKKSAMQAVPSLFDIVITTNSGYPLDMNLYQSVKGMSAAAQVVCPGGSIIIAAQCSDGLPEHGMYAQILRTHQYPQQVLDAILSSPVPRQDQWQVQIQALIQLKADVYVYSDLDQKQIRSALFLPSRSIEQTVSSLKEKYGPQPRICVLPEGPQTIPYLKSG
jgi:lactate racemase